MSADLSTRYLGLPLAGPLAAAASPLTGELDSLRRLEDAGASAVTLPSLFEEQIEHEEMELHRLREFGAESYGEAHDYFPELEVRDGGPDRYLRLIEAAKGALGIPVFASLNGHTAGGWVRYAKLFEEAGADAVELNVYEVPTDPEVDADAVERGVVHLVGAVRREVRVPLAVKIGPYFSAPANMARRLASAGADGLVLFNRFLHPDIDLETLRVAPALHMSAPEEARLALRWIAILRGRVKLSLAATGGAHSAEDALRLLLAGADVVTFASALLEKGPAHLRRLTAEIRRWMEEREYASVEQMKGSLSLQACPDPKAYVRGNYMRALLSYTSRVL